MQSQVFCSTLTPGPGVQSGADPGFFLGGGAPLRNGVADW